MKKILSLLIIAAMLTAVSGCGKQRSTGSSITGDGKEKTEATVTPAADQNAAETPLPTVSATQAAFVDSDDVAVVSSEEIPIAEKKEDFEQSAETDGFVKYTSGDSRWGLLLPENAAVGDEDEGGVIFMLNQNPIAVNTMEEPVALRSVEEAKQYYSILTDVKVNRFTVIYDGDNYAGCCFDYEAPNGAFGFGKYAIKGKNAACASAINMAGDAGLNDTLRDAVNSLVVFE